MKNGGKHKKTSCRADGLRNGFAGYLKRTIHDAGAYR